MHESGRLTDQELQKLMDLYTLRTVNGQRVWPYEHDLIMRALYELEDRRAAVQAPESPK